jgi:GH15 family glucan-1,4-alpha-glucosidase
MGDHVDIADYGFVSDTNTAALVSRDGSIDWYCPGRFDAPAVFARILDPDAGHWSLHPTEAADVERSYAGDSLVLRTRFRTGSGTVEILDALALRPGSDGHGIGHDVPRVLVRVVRGVEGIVRMTSDLRARFDYGLSLPTCSTSDDVVVLRRGSVTLQLGADVAVDVDRDAVTAEFDVSAGDEVGFTLAHAGTFRADEPSRRDAGELMAATREGWESWMDLHRGYDGRHTDLVRRSALVLQGLTFQPSGAVVAAATAGLPEELGGDDNYDYRFVWLRDLSMTLQAQWVAACPDEPARFFRWLTAAVGVLDGTDPQILYGIEGERIVTEQELGHLRGFAGSRPVRIGNAAWEQRQLDVMGEVLNAAHLLRDQLQFDDHTRRLLLQLTEHAADRWRDADAGMWEARDRHRHYVTSKVLCWVALDRAIDLADRLDATDRVARWREIRDEIHATVLADGWNEQAGAYTGAFGSDQLDASVLLMPIVGFLPATDERMRATIDRIEGQLAVDGAVRRWRTDPGSFLLTAFWLVECLALAGDTERAEAWFDRTAAHANDLGLMSEEIDPATGAFTGNFPQAFSHVGLVNAAWRLTQVERGDAGEY